MTWLCDCQSLDINSHSTAKDEELRRFELGWLDGIRPLSIIRPVLKRASTYCSALAFDLFETSSFSKAFGVLKMRIASGIA